MASTANILFSLAIIFMIAATGFACPPGWSFYKGDNTCLQVFALENGRAQLKWSDARMACQVFGGDLVEIRDKEKSDFVWHMSQSIRYNGPWIGVSNVAKVGLDFEFLDGTHVKYQPWSKGYPKGRKEGDWKCVHINVDFSLPAKLGDWADSYCSWTRSYVCSIENE